jgi:hypothetical protein
MKDEEGRTVADVAGEERAGRVDDLPGDLEGCKVQLLESVLLTHDPQLLTVTIVGQRLHHVCVHTSDLPLLYYKIQLFQVEKE